MKKTKNPKNELEIICNQFKKIYMNGERFKLIESVNRFEMKENMTSKDTVPTKYYDIGCVRQSINSFNYTEVKEKAINDSNYVILFQDFSYVTMYYQFDEKKRVTYASLSYVPYYEKEDCNILAKYIRIDFEEQGYIEFIHPLSHIHISLFDTEIRLPLDHIVTPDEFLYFVLVHIYHCSDEKIKLLNLSYKLEKIVLSNEEIKKFKFSFGN